MAFNIRDKVKEAAKSVNMNEAQGGGGGYTPPAEGHPNLRLVGYYELGQHVEQYGQAKGKVKDKVRLVWELSGKLYPVQEVNGEKIPVRITQTLTRSLNERATLYKLFRTMNEAHGDKYTHIAEMLGEAAFKGTVKHTVKGEGEQKRTYANLINIRKAEREDEDGNLHPITVDPPITPIKGFLWDQADPEMWDDIFIAGEYEERKDDSGKVIKPAKSKNVLQAEIMSAVNFKGSPIFDYANGKIKKEDLAAMQEALADSSEDEQGPDALDDIA